MAINEGLARVISNEWVSSEYKHMVLQAESRMTKVEPGQFFNLLCPQTADDKPFFRRPMSTYFASEASATLEFLYKVTGAGTRGLATLQTGDDLGLLGPLGKGFSLKSAYRHILVVGRGVGLATLAPLAERAAGMNIHITALLSSKDNTRLMSQNRFSAAGARVIAVTDAEGSSSVASLEQLIRQIHRQQPIDAFYTCGSVRLTKLLQQLVNEFGAEGEVALEQHMACGMGMCYCCVRAIRVGQNAHTHSKRVCYDGPVFNIAEVEL